MTRSVNQAKAKVVIKSATADLIREMVDECSIRTGKTQEDIALKTGFVRSNVLTMIKQGRTRMPLDKIGFFSKACGVAPDRLLKTALSEYHPELARLVGEVYKSSTYEGIEEIAGIVNDAITEKVVETKAKMHEQAADEQQQIQAKRLSGSLDLSLHKRVVLKHFIKNNMVRITAGSEVILTSPDTETI